MQPCANCGAPHAAPYCPQCGQQRVAPGIRLRDVLGDFVSSLYNVDAPLPYTLRSFFRSPARLTHDYIAGRRKAYTPPVRLFLMGVGFYYLMRFFLTWDPVDAAVMTSAGAPPPETPMMRVNHWMSRNVNLLLPLLLLMLATADRLLYPRTRLGWTERLVHYLFAAGTYLVVATLIIPLYRVWPGLQLLGFVVILGIITAATIALHRRSVWSVTKAVVMVPVTFVLYVMLCTVLVALLLDVPLDQLMQRPPR